MHVEREKEREREREENLTTDLTCCSELSVSKNMATGNFEIQKDVCNKMYRVIITG